MHANHFAWPAIIITSDSSATCSAATTAPLRSVVFRLITPLPPRDVMRYSASGVRFPKPFSEIGEHQRGQRILDHVGVELVEILRGDFVLLLDDAEVRASPRPC